ncbi:hypothetical protein E8E13_001994 [Curvularia kusanoi]|uniref:Uncharacterized protein n=1 Tax=Curvularia kusanoi TaxID=90978 RepID=A0A9P4T7D9_CURKU|nr:hypothetical protein E8E13_001994 [Curvularia kusanoi]
MPWNLPGRPAKTHLGGFGFTGCELRRRHRVVGGGGGEVAPEGLPVGFGERQKAPGHDRGGGGGGGGGIR